MQKYTQKPHTMEVEAGSGMRKQQNISKIQQNYKNYKKQNKTTIKLNNTEIVEKYVSSLKLTSKNTNNTRILITKEENGLQLITSSRPLVPFHFSIK